MGEEAPRLLRFRQRLHRNLSRRVPGLWLNGDPEHRLPGSLNLSFPGLTAPELIEACPSVAMSTGSACTSAAVEPSYVLRALGLPDQVANGSIRLGLGRFTTEAEVDFAADAIASAALRLQGRGPASEEVTKAAAIPTSG
jgi:cysteine desulfurase